VWVHVFGVLTQLFIVFANDAADYATDGVNTTYNRFSGGSRVVPEGKLAPQDLAIASLVCLAAMALASVYLVFRELRLFMLIACSVPPLLIWAYSFGPLRLSYRGRGEVLQGLGVGVVLPVIAFYAQSGRLSGMPLAALFGSYLLAYAGNVTTALPDTPSDRASDKRTYPVRLGERAARRDSLIFIVIGCIALAVDLGRGRLALAALVTAVPLLLVALNVPRIASADAENHAACERFVWLSGGAIMAAWAGWSALLFAA
jgi:1,4-dihydroxy-2-naphthoate octaprenyltransferase